MEPLNAEVLGARLRAARERASMSQTEAAHVLELTPAAINQYESGKRRIDALALERLARAYGVRLDALLGRGTEPAPADWESALRRVSRDVPEAGKIGIGRLVDRLGAFEELYDKLGVPVRGRPHPPFAPLPDERLNEQAIRDRAEGARQHFGLGTSPIRNVKDFLEAHSYQVFALDLGAGPDDLSGLHFVHPRLGHIAVIDESQAVTRWPFSLAHEFAHGLFHYDRPAISCRSMDRRPAEQFADGFAGHFLVPDGALRERLRSMNVSRVEDVATVVDLARYFGVSFLAMVVRLRKNRKLNISDEALQHAKPLNLARRLGYRPTRYELGDRPLPIEERLPRACVRLGYAAVDRGVLSLRRVAELFGISDIELRERLEESPEAAEMDKAIA